jgi:hypothetical protein
MSETHYCPVQTHPATRDSPPEWCENEVPSEDDFCPIHEPDEPDWDAIRKDAKIDARHE